LELIIIDIYTFAPAPRRYFLAVMNTQAKKYNAKTSSGAEIISDLKSKLLELIIIDI
jgi:hypothetical protein